ACGSTATASTCSTMNGVTTRTSPRRIPDVGSVRHRQSRWSNALFVAPYLFAFATLLVYPLFAGIALSLNKADFFGQRRFVGLENFARLFNDDVFLGAMWNTFYFILLTVPALAIIGLALALTLNRQTRTAAFLRG